MKHDIHYEVKFLDYWHLSSGISAGSKLDSSVVKDSDQLPYIPGKTVKGLVREAAEMLDENDFVRVCFGDEGNQSGVLFFSNATLREETKAQIVQHKLQDNLYDEIASTQIDDNGIAVDNSLREIEAVVPLTMQGTVRDVPEAYVPYIHKSLKMVKRMGLNRNRGLGRCEISIKEQK